MPRTALFFAATLALVLSGCNAAIGVGATTPDGDTFRQAFQYFFNGPVFPTPPGEDDGEAVETAIAADRGPAESDPFGTFWAFETYDEPLIRIVPAGGGGMSGLVIDWECSGASCGTVTETAADYQAIVAAVEDVLTDFYGAPDDEDVGTLFDTTVWNEVAFDVVLQVDHPSGTTLGGVSVLFEVPVS